jgi:hypothetical protein
VRFEDLTHDQVEALCPMCAELLSESISRVLPHTVILEVRWAVQLAGWAMGTDVALARGARRALRVLALTPVTELPTMSDRVFEGLGIEDRARLVRGFALRHSEAPSVSERPGELVELWVGTGQSGNRRMQEESLIRTLGMAHSWDCGDTGVAVAVIPPRWYGQMNELDEYWELLGELTPEETESPAELLGELVAASEAGAHTGDALYARGDERLLRGARAAATSR